MSSDLTDGRAEALLAKEAAVTEEQKRAAGITLAGLSLAASDGDWTKAGRTLREALMAVGIIAYVPLNPPKTSRMQAIVNYGRPGQ